MYLLGIIIIDLIIIFNDFWVYIVGWWMYNFFLLIIRDKLIFDFWNKILSFIIWWVIVMIKYLFFVLFIWIDFVIYMYDNVLLKDICLMKFDLWFLCFFFNEFFYIIYYFIW